MADLNYTARVDVSQAEASLTRLQKSVAGVSDSFIRLKTTLASISLGAVISQSLQFADAISDLSDASEIAIGNIVGFQNAVMASGGSAAGAQKAILKLVNSIGEAADGSASLQQAFRDVGVTIEDLRNTSNEDILKKTIAGLDKMENSAKRSVLVTKLLGEEFRNVNAGSLGAAYAEASARSQQYADAIKKGADAQQNIDKTLGEFKLGLLEAIKPFTELISKVNIGVDAFQKFVQALLAVGAALASVFLVGKVISALRALYVVIAEIVVAAGGLGQLFGNLINGFGAIWRATEGAGGAFSRVLLAIRAVGAAILEILAPAFTALKPLALPILAAIAAGWGWVQDSTSAAIDKLREYASALTFGLIKPPSGGGAGRGNGQAELDQRKKDADEAAKAAQALREVTDRTAEAYAKAGLETKINNDLLAVSLSRVTENIALETRMINLSKLKNVISEDEVEIIKMQSDLDVQRLAKIKDLSNQQDKLRLSLAYAKDEEKAGINANIQALGKQITFAEDAYKVQADGVRTYMTELQTARKLDAARLQDMENMKKAIEDQISRQQALGDIIRGARQQAAEVKDATPTSQLTGLSSIQRQIVEIQDSARRAAIEAGRSFAANFEDGGDGLTPERAQELADGLDQIAEAYRGVADAQIGVATNNYETSRSFSTGWKDAFASYTESASNSADQAKMYFETFTGGMEDAMVKFAQTGKLSFKDLANSIIADLIRIQTRKMIVSAMSGGLGGVLGGIGSLFGFAAGGATDMSPMIVGERGPELFIPNSAGKIIPNNQLGNNQPVQQVTNVNYSIQAVDAASFKQMVARDPQFIYSVTEKGRRSVPTRR